VLGQAGDFFAGVVVVGLTAQKSAAIISSNTENMVSATSQKCFSAKE